MPNDLSRLVLGNLASACLQGGLIILAVWAICRFYRGLNAAVRQGLWWLACLKLLITVVWIRPISLAILPLPKTMAPDLLASAASTASPMAHAAVAGSHYASVSLWLDCLAAAWLIGASVVAAAALKDALTARRVVKGSTPIDATPLGEDFRGLAAEIGVSTVPKLARSTQVSSPCVVGHWHPVVVVPEDFEQTLTPEEQRMALAHELAHVRRADLWMAIVPSCAYALFYFFPPVWVACREWATDREASCDLDALRATGAKPKAYGEMLMKIARSDHRRLIPGLGATRQFHTLRRRMSSIVEGAGSRRMRWGSAALLALVAMFIVPITLASPSTPNSVLSNAGFEQGIDSPAGWIAINPGAGFDLAWDANVAHTGSRSVRITRTTNRYWPIAKWEHEIPFDGSASSIEFGAWIKADHAGKAVLDAQFEGPNHFWHHQWVAFIGELSPGQGPATHDWALYSGVVNIPTGTRTIKLSLQDYGPGTVWMDDAFAQFIEATPSAHRR